jgi:hypothetical protein
MEGGRERRYKLILSIAHTVAAPCVSSEEGSFSSAKLLHNTTTIVFNIPIGKY